MYLAELYRKHGFHVIEKHGCLLISFSSPMKIDIITMFVESSDPLNFQQIKDIYNQLYKIGSKVQCYQYRVICNAGFKEETVFFDDLNIALSGNDYIESLQKLNHIELYSHNDIAYTKLTAMLQVENKACSIQPTGTGKSLIISKFISEHPKNQFIVLTPSLYIIDEIKKHILGSENVVFFTYAKLKFLTTNEVESLKPDYIVFDEFHRCGANEWGKEIKKLIESFPDSKLIGTTATHIRYLDDKRNMADELFEANISSHLTLSRALALRILPLPKYVSALYHFEEEYLRVKKSIDDSMADDKKILIERLNNIRLSFENTNSIPQILKAHLTDDVQKILVFAKDIKRLKLHKPIILDSFRSIGFDNLSIYEVYSQNHENNKRVFNAFAKQHDKKISIMFSVDMLNEGIHVKGVNCIIMLRETTIPIIYYQQLGRCLTVGADKPLIFDFVNNFANIRHRDFKNEVSVESKKLSNFFDSKGISYEEIEFDIIDKVRDFRELLEDVERCADSWSIFFDGLKAFFDIHGHCNVPFSSGWLGVKLVRVRVLYRKQLLSTNRIEQLNSLGVEWDLGNEVISYEEFFEKLLDFKNSFGHFIVPRNGIYKSLSQKISTLRGLYKKGLLSDEKILSLNSIGFTWSIRYEKEKNAYESFIEELMSFKGIHGHCNVPKSYCDKLLANRVIHYRNMYRTKRLSKDKIEHLESIGFIWKLNNRDNNKFNSF